MFNRVGFVILVVLGIYFTIQSIRDARARAQDAVGDRTDY
jgi:hypothetical protein